MRDHIRLLKRDVAAGTVKLNMCRLQIFIRHTGTNVGFGFLQVPCYLPTPRNVEMWGEIYHIHKERGPRPIMWLRFDQPLYLSARFYVYGIFKDQTECVYIGASMNPSKRSRCHPPEYRRYGYSMRILHTGTYEEIKALETQEIANYRAKFPGLRNIDEISNLSDRGERPPTLQEIKILRGCLPKPALLALNAKDPEMNPANY